MAYSRNSFCGLDEEYHTLLMDRYEQKKQMTEEQNEILDEKEFMADGLPYYSLDDHPDQPVHLGFIE